MYNYNRDVYQAEHERAEAMRVAAERAVPYHLRSNNGKRARQWLSNRILQPVGQRLGALASATSYHGGRYWRRGSTRTLGLIRGLIGEVIEHVPDRA